MTTQDETVELAAGALLAYLRSDVTAAAQFCGVTEAEYRAICAGRGARLTEAGAAIVHAWRERSGDELRACREALQRQGTR